MRKNLMLSIAALVITYAANAQSNAIKVNLLSPVVRTINLSYERAISENGSIQLGFFYTGAKVSDVKIDGFGLTPEYRFYLSSTPAPNGFYVAPFLRYINFKAEDQTDNTINKATVTQFGAALLSDVSGCSKKE